MSTLPFSFAPPSQMMNDDDILAATQGKRIELLGRISTESAANDPKVGKLLLSGLKDAESIIVAKRKLKQEEEQTKDIAELSRVLLHATRIGVQQLVNQPVTIDHEEEEITLEIPDSVLDKIEPIADEEKHVGAENISFEDIVNK